MKLRPAISRLVCAILLVAAGQKLHAETIRIRAGEHDGFTRLVLEPAEKTGWQLGRTKDGYALRLARADVGFDTTAIFSRVPRSRLANVTAAPAGVLMLAVSCGCHASAFDTAGGRIVIDIAGGRPTAESPFEKPLAIGDGQTGAAARPLPHPSTAMTTAAASAGITATLVYRPSQNENASLPIYWRSLTPDAATAEPVPTSPGSGQSAQGNAGPDITRKPARTEYPVIPGPDPLPAGLPPILPLLPKGVPEENSGRVLRLPVPDPDVLATETEIRRQLSRAAAQGLVRVDPRIAERSAKAVPAKELEPPAAPQRQDVNSAAEGANDRRSGADGQIAFHAETSMDRDALDNPKPRQLTADGQSCLDDAALDLADWGDETPAMVQLSAARAHLTGEFDRPDPAEIARLARLYLFFGMGAEARQVLTAFNVEIEGAPTLSDLGVILDDLPVDPASALHQMRDCNTAVALWAFLAAASADEVRFADAPRVVRTFSGLPGHLRYLLGQRVTNRLTEIGAADAARSVRNAVARHAAPEDRLVGMIDAGIDLDHGRAEAAENELDELARGNDALSSQAVTLAIRSRLARGEAVDPEQVESIAALAFEHRNSPDGPALAHTEVMAHAGAGDFGAAFASYERWKTESPDVEREETALQLFGLLAAKAPDPEFLTAYFAWRRFLPDAGPDLALRLDMAGRLSSLGFAEEVREVLTGEAAHTGRGQRQLARAALDLFEPEKALEVLANLNGGDVLALRAEAYAMIGDHLSAADALADLGATEAAGPGGDRGGAATGPETLRSAVAKLGLAADRPERAVGGAVTLQSTRSMLEDSIAMRQTLNELLGPPVSAEIAAPQNPDGG